MRLVFLIAMIFTGLVSGAQSFEGKIIYKNSYQSKIPNVSDEQLTGMMGSRQEYFIKNGDYKSVTNGASLEWQLYSNKDNKLYSKMTNSETLLWNDGASNSDVVISATVNKAVTEILGYKCDELILTCKSGTQKYYYNSKLKVEDELFKNHKYGNWYEFVSRSEALPLKSIFETAQFTLESVAVEVKPSVLDKTVFELPPNAKTMKSPY